jgi:general secretion pathway protein K
VPDANNVKIFTQLLRNVQLDPSLAQRVAGFVSSGLPAGAPPENGVQPVPVTGAPLRITQVDDLLAVQGVTPAIVERLRPFVTVLPEQQTKVNVNTAPAEVLAAVVSDMSVSEANTLIVRRKQAAWRDMNYFKSQLSGNQAPIGDSADVKSNWFLVDSHIRLDRAALDAQALIQRSGNLLAGGGPKVRWIRQY